MLCQIQYKCQRSSEKILQKEIKFFIGLCAMGLMEIIFQMSLVIKIAEANIKLPSLKFLASLDQ